MSKSALKNKKKRDAKKAKAAEVSEIVLRIDFCARFIIDMYSVHCTLKPKTIYDL